MNIRLSPWLSLKGDMAHCVCRVLEGTDPSNIDNIYAFIEKSGRCRVYPGKENEKHDYTKYTSIQGTVWLAIARGSGGSTAHCSSDEEVYQECIKEDIYGYNKHVRYEVDKALIEQGYILSENNII